MSVSRGQTHMALGWKTGKEGKWLPKDTGEPRPPPPPTSSAGSGAWAPGGPGLRMFCSSLYPHGFAQSKPSTVAIESMGAGLL